MDVFEKGIITTVIILVVFIFMVSIFSQPIAEDGMQFPTENDIDKILKSNLGENYSILKCMQCVNETRLNYIFVNCTAYGKELLCK